MNEHEELLRGIQFTLVSPGYKPDNYGVMVVMVYEDLNDSLASKYERDILMPCPEEGFLVRSVDKLGDKTGNLPFPVYKDAKWNNAHQGRMFVMNSVGLMSKDEYYLKKENDLNTKLLESLQGIRPLRNGDVNGNQRLRQLLDENGSRHDVNVWSDDDLRQLDSEHDDHDDFDKHGVGGNDDVSDSDSWVDTGDEQQQGTSKRKGNKPPVDTGDEQQQGTSKRKGNKPSDGTGDEPHQGTSKRKGNKPSDDSDDPKNSQQDLLDKSRAETKQIQKKLDESDNTLLKERVQYRAIYDNQIKKTFANEELVKQNEALQTMADNLENELKLSKTEAVKSENDTIKLKTEIEALSLVVHNKQKLESDFLSIQANTHALQVKLQEVENNLIKAQTRSNSKFLHPII